MKKIIIYLLSFFAVPLMYIFLAGFLAAASLVIPKSICPPNADCRALSIWEMGTLYLREVLPISIAVIVILLVGGALVLLFSPLGNSKAIAYS